LKFCFGHLLILMAAALDPYGSGRERFQGKDRAWR
jgi:hypothetical protein